MVIIRPDLIEEWNFEKNDKLGLDIREITIGMGKNVWWCCPKCKSIYATLIRKRTQGNNCPYCRGLKVNNTNSLEVLRPDLAKEWHPTKNGELTPNDVTKGKRLKVWWICELGHEWKINIRNRNNGSGCPYCVNRSKKVKRRYNDMWTTNPELAKQLANPEDGYKYTQSSNVRVDWVCQNCKAIISNKKIYQIRKNGISCNRCSDGISFGEKVVYNILEQQGIMFTREKTFDWSNNKRYDFYLPHQNTVIEVHGMQHYQQTSRKSARTLEEEQANDRYKYEMAMNNDIENYIVIDARESSTEWIKNSLLNNKNNYIIKTHNIDWIECSRYASKSLIIEVCEYWKNNGKPSTLAVSQKFKIGVPTIVKFLKQGASNGWCDYDVDKSRLKGMQLLGLKRRKVLCQLSLNGELIKEWDYINNVAYEFNVTPSAIAKACKSKSHKSCGFKWMYKEDYDEMINK